MGSDLKNRLKFMCCAHDWCYAVFWRFHPPNSLLLTLEDTYYEGQLGQEIANRFPQLHLLCEGWRLLANLDGCSQMLIRENGIQRVFFGVQYHFGHDSELRQQFSSGIKTIAVIFVKPCGVVQIGSTQKILEREDILEQTQGLLMGTKNVDDHASLDTVLPWDIENYDQNGLLASENLCSWNLNSDDDEYTKALLRNAYFSVSVDKSFPPTYKNHEEGMTSFRGESSRTSLASSSRAQDVTVEDSASNGRGLGPGGTFQDKYGNLLNHQPSTQSLLNHIRENTYENRKREESTKTVRKYRQQIQDGIKELRGIIPSGGKCSIDSLLDRSIKYMFFLGSITKYADKLQEPKNPKLIEEANGVVVKDKSVGESDSEIAGQTMVYPIIVKDMSPPGQMLIEMLCEEQGWFLEIAEVIGGFGLNILSGKMEIRGNKLLGRFIVEANRRVTRIDVFKYLVQILRCNKQIPLT